MKHLNGQAGPGRRRCLARGIFYGFCLLAWLSITLLALEAWARMGREPEAPTPETIPFTIQSARDLFTDVYARYSSTWPAPLPQIPDLEALGQATEEMRRNIAEARGEWILTTDREGAIRHAYGRAPLQDLPQTVAELDQACTFIHAAQAASFQDAVSRLFNGQRLPSQSLLLKSAGGEDTMWAMFLGPEEFGKGEEAAFVLAPSLYRRDLKRFKPNLSPRTFTTSVMMEQFSTNSLGYRGGEVAVPKPKGTVRIACLGGSTTVWGFTDELTYPAMLQRMLRDHFSEAAERIEVVNCGVFGLTSEEEVMMVEEIARLEPDFLVYYNFINDLTVHFGHWLHEDPLWPGPVEHAKLLLRNSRFLDRYVNSWLLPGADSLNTLLKKITLDNLSRIVDDAGRFGMEAAFCSFAGLTPETVAEGYRAYAEGKNIRTLFPDLDLTSYTGIRNFYNGQLRALCREKGALYIPVAESVQGGYDLFMDICHFNPRGTEMQARAVFESLKVPVGEKLSGM